MAGARDSDASATSVHALAAAVSSPAFSGSAIQASRTGVVDLEIEGDATAQLCMLESPQQRSRSSKTYDETLDIYQAAVIEAETEKLAKSVEAVGTTEFDSLIAAATSEPILKTLFAKGYTSVTLQIGRGKFEPETSTKSNFPAVDWYRFKSDISGDIKTADLVIGHAGSGTCLEVLSAGRPLIVVVNESLHDNHQLELADRLGSDGHLLYCAPDTLGGALEKLDRVDLVPFEPGRPEVFVQWLDRFTGIVD